MPDNSPKVTAVVLNLLDTPGLLECLRSADRVDYPAFEILVVHNGPRSGGFEAAARGASARVSGVIFTGYNAGFAGGSNSGIRAALRGGADYVLLLNDDTAVAPDFLGRLVAQALAEPGAGLLGPRILYFSEPEKIWFSGARFDAENVSFTTPGAGLTETAWGRAEPERSDYLTGCCLLASRAALEAVGLLDERLFLYWEDADLGLRAIKAGFRPTVVPAARIWHKVSSTVGGEDSPLKVYHKTRGRLQFARAHAPRAGARLLYWLLKDIAWLLLKCRQPGRGARALACAAAAAHFLLGVSGPGPAWLWKKGPARVPAAERKTQI